MRCRNILPCLVGVALGGLLAFAQSAVWAEELTGRQIIDRVSELHERDFEKEVQKMTLIDKSGTTEERLVYRYARDEGATARFLLVFHEPAGIKGSALLTWQHDDKDDDQWLYLPAMGKQLKRIAKGGRKNAFMGTDYTFEDLVSESRDKFTYERLPDQQIDGVDCHVVDTIPSDPEVAKESGYKSRRLYVRKDNLFIVRTDYFDRRGNELKRQTATDLVEIGNGGWRANASRMENLRSGHATEIKVVERKFAEEEVPESIFRERFILSGRHVK